MKKEDRLIIGTIVAGLSISLIGFSLRVVPRIATIKTKDPEGLKRMGKRMDIAGNAMMYFGGMVGIVGVFIGMNTSKE